MVNFIEYNNNNNNNNNNNYEDYYSETESDIDEIFEQDIEHVENEKDIFKYYIGITKLIKPCYYYLLLNSISAKMFFRYPYKTILNYLSEYSLIETYNPKIDILKLIVIDDVYTVLKKTYWIKIIQRHWKNVLKDRYNMILKRGSILAQRNFEITGKYPFGMRVLPGLNGMLKMYNYKFKPHTF
jgi:hypothetical protein